VATFNCRNILSFVHFPNSSLLFPIILRFAGYMLLRIYLTVTMTELDVTVSNLLHGASPHYVSFLFWKGTLDCSTEVMKI
jgi:hypothetical protein